MTVESMTMVRKLRGQLKLATVAGTLMATALAWVGSATCVHADPPPVHYHHAGIMPPGAIGSQQLKRGGPLPGYYQPVEIKGPPGTLISTAVDGQFSDPQPGPLTAGMLIGAVYRLRVTNIPLQAGLEVFPTVEVIDRIYPPVGQAFRFPIPIELTQEELELAMAGRFVTRVIYLEDPNNAAPVARAANEQAYFQVADGDNPLDVADSLGRPVAILRLGGRVPDVGGPDETFMFGSPPYLLWKPHEPTIMSVAGDRRQRPQTEVRQASAIKPLRMPNLSRTFTK